MGAIEAEAGGNHLSGVEEQTGGYLFGLPEGDSAWPQSLAFGYESTGSETFFVDTIWARSSAHAGSPSHLDNGDFLAG